jgi:hypothetical protein
MPSDEPPVPSAEGGTASRKRVAMTRLTERVAESTLGVVAVYSFAAWAYVALCALVHPETLALPLTHLIAWPREDTFGVMCFALSFVTALGRQVLRARRAWLSTDTATAEDP